MRTRVCVGTKVPAEGMHTFRHLLDFQLQTTV